MDSLWVADGFDLNRDALELPAPVIGVDPSPPGVARRARGTANRDGNPGAAPGQGSAVGIVSFGLTSV